MSNLKTTLTTLALALCTFATAQTAITAPNKKTLKSLGLAQKELTAKSNGVWTLKDGTTIYSSKPYGNNIKGFRGPTPLFIAVSKNGKILGVAPDKNNETQTIWARVIGSRLFKSWNGMTPREASTAKVDAVSGATYSSTGVIKTVQATARKISK